MTRGTTKLLYDIKDKLTELRENLDRHMYCSASLPDEDHDYCRKVYSAICKVMDLL